MSSAGSQSISERNKALMVRWFEEVWNQGRIETIKELLGNQCVINDGSATMRGPEGFTQFHDHLRAQFTDFSIRPLVSLAEDDLVCVRWSAAFVHKESGRPVNLTGTTIGRVQNGQFVEAWQNWDAAGLAAQLTAPGTSKSQSAE
jgi:predicted SnoaL-like aldol condensation-catalyzing enzyme